MTISKHVISLAVACLLSAPANVTAQTAQTGLGGPSSVEAALSTTDRQPLAERFHFGFDYSVLGQVARGDANDEAVGGAARLYGTFDLYGDEAGDQGTLTFKIENRHRLGTSLAPQDLGFAVGYVGLPAITYSDAGWVLTNLFWQHSSADNRWAVVAGITDVTDYVDVYELGNPWAEFSNLVFSTNPTIAAPNQGFGLAGRYRFRNNAYVLAGIADSNADPSDPFDSLSDFFSDPEPFIHAEIGWVSSWEDRFSDNLHLTLWHADNRTDAGVPSGRGAAFSASWRIGDRFLPFARFGASDGGGALLERSASVGLGYTTGRRDDRIALGLNWGKPNSEDYGDSAPDQVTAEVYWRIRPVDWLEITPDVQYIRNPALNSGIRDVWIFGLRLRAVF